MMASRFSLRRAATGLARGQPHTCSSTKRFQTTAAVQTQNPSYPLYPSVIQLLHENKISDDEVSKMPATGPNGRLLKGDVLAYLGAISKDYPAIQASRIAQIQHLDLSNIKIAPPAGQKSIEPIAEGLPTPEEKLPSERSLAVSISLKAVLLVQKRIQDTLGIEVPLSTFISRATEAANDSLPRSKSTKPTSDEIFDEILGIAPQPGSFEAFVRNSSHGNYIPDVNVISTADITKSPDTGAEEDIIDFLAGHTKAKPATLSSVPISSDPAPSAINVFSLTVPANEENRAREFLDRFRDLLQVNPGRLVL